MKIVISQMLAGNIYLFASNPVPVPLTVVGALLVVAMSVGFVGANVFL